MWTFATAVLEDPALAALISMFVGGLIAWLAAWIYYKRAGDEFRAETALLKKANRAIAYMIEHPDAEIEVRRDKEGNPTGFIVSALLGRRAKQPAGVQAPMRVKTPNQSLQPTALWRCASMSILITVFSTVAKPRSQSGG